MFQSERPDGQHGFIQNAFVFDNVHENFGMAGTACGRNLGPHAFGAQRHDAIHGADPFGTDLNAFHASCAIPHAARLIKMFEPVCGGGIPGVGNKAIRFSQSSRADEVLVDFQDGAVGDADPAHDAAHDTG